jgi:hypothetical protein
MRHRLTGFVLAALIGLASFELPAQQGFDDPIIAFDDPIIAFDDPIIAFDDPIIAFEVPLFQPVVEYSAALTTMHLTTTRYGSYTGTKLSRQGTALSAKAQAGLKTRLQNELALARKYQEQSLKALHKAGKKSEATAVGGSTKRLDQLAKTLKAPEPLDLAKTHADIVQLQSQLLAAGTNVVPHLGMKGALVAIRAELGRLDKMLEKGKLCSVCWPALEVLSKYATAEDETQIAKLATGLKAARQAKSAAQARSALAKARKGMDPLIRPYQAQKPTTK